ncbi:hypothetical protein LHYA1_G002430 [Lachnellula hyalina]|uniref:F-box domain-containing protein n=1 Tax=Lachnellula hyalina TaxID=1316788 RepID=A0A8H8R591_9HELO|nr:uncharacterized protein LHYA1_G002430 [Lachnellula hyalina]TVY28683.1 hypothetical protein LHYA1_G002430 [Lachnellula hyalina]
MKRNSKSKSVATYTQRLSRSQNSTWKEPAIRSSKIIQIPTPQQSFVDDDDDDDNDDDLSDATGEYIIVASHVESSQSEFIDDGSVADQIITEEVAVEDTTPQDGADEHAYKSVATSYSGKLFKDFPVEIHQHISCYLPTARDVARYSEICRSSAASITDTVWRERFEQTFDRIPGSTTREVAKKYRFRCSVSGLWTCFDLGRYGATITNEIRGIQQKNQNDCLEMLRTLIIESDARKVRDSNGNVIVDGLNLRFIRSMITNKGDGKFVDIIDSVLNTEGALNCKSGASKVITANKPGSLVYVIQLALTPISLHPGYCNNRVTHFDVSQMHAYSTAKAQPIFVGKVLQDINVRWLLHTINFFKFHFKSSRGEGIIANDYALLEPDQYVQPWVGLIEAGTQPLGRFWKGAHTFMDNRDVWALRTDKNAPSHIYSDSVDPGENFPELEIHFDESKFPSSCWPVMWERMLRSNPFVDTNAPVNPSSRRSPRKTKSAKLPPILTFYGQVSGSKPAHFYGRLHALPQQQGLHGFQRMVLMKFYTDSNGDYNPEQLFCYEGCVLPGGKIIVGRWWDAFADPRDDSTASGPFIWWNIERNAAGITADMVVDSNATAPGDNTIAFFDEVPK